MTDSHDRVSGARPDDDAATDPDAMTFFEDEAPSRVRAGGSTGDGLEGDATGGAPGPNAGYTGGLAEGNQGAVGMRQVIADETADRRRDGVDDEPPGNLAQQDQ
ncbi:MAG TPA: hypothetical protein VFY23_11055 [Candidatus Limnocylindrales bacterium]|nr:hypothetical protein [Candidatus Limnocylindrales bacterium]